ncbi:hypothetical protein BZZ01_20235 [Nostocales cyanobacterium HT-58-2]|nr:hypothetical protein BZZ01_20235 [Nostocales cyanobacterium HT-58-2]
MAIATRTDSTLSANFTQSTFVDALKQAFLNAGFSNPIDDYTGGTDRILVYSQTVDNTKTYGTNYLRIRITSGLVIYQQLLTAWNTSNHSGSNASAEYAYNSNTLNTNSPVSFTSINGGNEYKFVTISNSYFWILGLLTPEKRPSWWDLNSFSYGFIPIDYSYNSQWRSSNMNPYGNANYNSNIGAGNMANANPTTNKRDIITGILLYTQSNYGIGAKTSDDIVVCCANGIARNEVIAVGNNQYLVLQPITGGLGVRIA